ncbi:phospholipase D family protein [Reinekea sp.]|jgi:putative cardiolipin synthase|uniref:phospholipase D family protein n=1 Tax=Reinekea sp. TaxID=1970455 RepID=UPI003988CE5C
MFKKLGKISSIYTNKYGNLGLKGFIAIASTVGLLLFISLSCTSLPSLEGRVESSALSIAEAEQTRLGSAIAPLSSQHQQLSGIRLLESPEDAFAARVLLAQNAQKTLDLQYYIWHEGITSAMLFEAITDAANRGVRVRMLLDDNGIAGLDEALSALDRLENVQVRLFNPFVQRRFKKLGFITDFSRVNRRMHNKSFTVDNTVTVIGGRNIGDEYFGATSGILKQDLDLVAVGSVVNEVSVDFDKYWASASAYPIEGIVGSTKTSTYTTAEYMPAQLNNPERDVYIRALKSSSLVTAIIAQEPLFEWKPTRMVSDDPSKGIGKVDKEGLLMVKLGEVMGAPESTVLLVTPYFVPTQQGVDIFTALAKTGVSIDVLTNSMQATDVLSVHAGYAKHRKELLEGGVQLFELRPSTVDEESNIMKLGPFGSSASSLHAKTFAVDSQRLFVGSFNFDPRSMNLNTELGFVLESSTLAEKVEDEFSQRVRPTAYQLILDEDNKILWVESNGDKQTIHSTEPGMTLFSRAALAVFSALPIEWLL